MKSLLFLLLAVVGLHLTQSAPVANEDFCQRPANIRQAYNIGPNVYVAVSSSSIYRFDLATKSIAPGKEKLSELFSKMFRWVDMVISLQGICRSAPHLCDGAAEGELDRVHLVVGMRAHPSAYTFVIFDLDPVTGKFQPLEKLSATLTDRLNRLGISVKPDENGALPMDGPFWPSITGQPYYTSGVFSSDRAEMLINVYDSNLKEKKNFIRRGRVSASSVTGLDYTNENLAESYDNLGFVGMFHIGRKVFGIDSQNMVYEILTNDGMTLVKKGKALEFFDCFGNSTRDVTGTPSTTVPTTVAPPVVLPKVTEAKAQPEVEEKETTPEVEVVPVKAETGLADISQPKGNQEAKEKEIDENVLDDGLMSDHPTPGAHPVPPTGPSELVKAGARSPFSDKSDGLALVLICVVAGLIALAVLIMIPILIIRHKSRSNRMYLNKNINNQPVNGNGNSGATNGNNGHNGTALNGSAAADGPEEQVQLMNSYQLH